MWAPCLHEAVDGKVLIRVASVIPQSLWISNGTSMFTSRNFLRCVKTRINALPARSRFTRARLNNDRSRRAGCSAVETPNYCIQYCFRIHATRVKRHNTIVSHVQRSLVQRGLQATSGNNLQDGFWDAQTRSRGLARYWNVHFGRSDRGKRHRCSRGA